MRRPENNPVLICSASAPPVKSGAGINAHNFGLHLQKLGFHTRHFCFNSNLRYSTFSKASGLRVFRVPFLEFNVITRALSAIWTIPVLLLFSLSAKTIFIYGPIKGYLFLILFGKLTNRQIVYRSTMLGADDIHSLIHKYPLFKGFRKWALSKLGAYYAINPGFTESYVGVFGNSDKVIESPQGLDISRFAPISESEKKDLRMSLGLPLDVPVLVSVGYLINRKGYLELFENLAGLKHDFVYVVIGDHIVGPEHSLYNKNSEMKANFDKGNQLLGDKIIFTGPLPDVSSYLKAADIFLLNSEKEGVPNVLLEAMACGCVPVIKEISGLNGFITFPDKNSKVYTDISELNILISEVLIDSGLKSTMSKNAADFASGNLDFNKVSSKIMKKLGIALNEMKSGQ